MKASRSQTRTRQRLNQLAAKRTSRRKLIIIFVLLVVAAVAWVMLWYLPHRPQIIFERATINSLKQQSVDFTMLSGQGASASQSSGSLDAQGNSKVTIGKANQRLTVITIAQTTYIDAGDGRWLSLPSNSAQSVLGAQSSLTPKGSASGLQAADRQKLAQLYRKHSFLVVRAIYGEEPVDNQAAYHYLVAVDMPNLKDFLQAARQDIPSLGLKDSQLTSILGASLLDRPVEVWIGKDDGLIHRLGYGQGTDSPTVISLSAYGKTTTIAAPQNATPLLDTLRR